jgi:hypothetical protein
MWLTNIPITLIEGSSVVIPCYGMLQLNHTPSCRIQDRLDIRRPECRIRNFFKPSSDGV